MAFGQVFGCFITTFVVHPITVMGPQKMWHSISTTRTVSSASNASKSGKFGTQLSNITDLPPQNEDMTPRSSYLPEPLPEEISISVYDSFVACDYKIISFFFRKLNFQLKTNGN
jgi:hypothetical protein